MKEFSERMNFKMNKLINKWGEKKWKNGLIYQIICFLKEYVFWIESLTISFFSEVTGTGIWTPNRHWVWMSFVEQIEKSVKILSEHTFPKLKFE